MHELQILKYSHLEHFKAAKDLALVLPIDHERRIEVEKELNVITTKISNIKSIKK